MTLFLQNHLGMKRFQLITNVDLELQVCRNILPESTCFFLLENNLTGQN